MRLTGNEIDALYLPFFEIDVETSLNKALKVRMKTRTIINLLTPVPDGFPYQEIGVRGVLFVFGFLIDMKGVSSPATGIIRQGKTVLGFQ